MIVLRQHLDGVLVADSLVEVVSQFLEEVPEEFLRVATILLDQAADADDVASCDVRHVLRPILPVVPGAAFLDNLRHDGAGELVDDQLSRRRFDFAPIPATATSAANISPFALPPDRQVLDRRRDSAQFGALYSRPPVDDRDPVADVLAKPALVDHGVQPLVVSTERVQNLPNYLVLLVVGQRHVRRHVRRDPDRQDDVAHALAGRPAHHPPDRLHDVDLAVARVQEHDGVEGRHVHALGKAARVAEDAADVDVVILLQPVETAFALPRLVGAVHVPDLAVELAQRPVAVFRQEFRNHVAELVPDQLGGLDAPAERQGAVHGPRVIGAIPHQSRLGEGLPAADDLGRVVEHQFAVLVGKALLHGGADLPLVHGQHDHAVVREDAAVDRPGEAVVEQHVPVEIRIVHRRQHGVGVAGLGAGVLAVDARRSGHVEAFAAANDVVVVHLDEIRLVLAREGHAGRAVGLVADDQVEVGQAMLGLGVGDHRDRLVGGEHHAHRALVRRGHGGCQLAGIRGCGECEIGDFEFRHVVRATPPPDSVPTRSMPTSVRSTPFRRAQSAHGSTRANRLDCTGSVTSQAAISFSNAVPRSRCVAA